MWPHVAAQQVHAHALKAALLVVQGEDVAALLQHEIGTSWPPEPGAPWSSRGYPPGRASASI
jgi:hypothetical protein